MTTTTKMMTLQTVDTTPAAVTRRFLDALARRDVTAAVTTLDPGVWMRASTQCHDRSSLDPRCAARGSSHPPPITLSAVAIEAPGEAHCSII